MRKLRGGIWNKKREKKTKNKKPKNSGNDGPRKKGIKLEEWVSQRQTWGN